jgi:hypothetical protein
MAGINGRIVVITGAGSGSVERPLSCSPSSAQPTSLRGLKLHRNRPNSRARHLAIHLPHFYDSRFARTACPK